MYSPKYFKDKEFVRASPSCHLVDMDEGFIYKLDQARELCEFPFIVNSAFRDVDYEKSKNRKGTSSHCKGLAVDLRCNSSYVRYFILDSLLRVGFRRIGVYNSYIHVDDDPDKVSGIWLNNTDVVAGRG